MYESRNAECLNLQKKRKSNSFWNIEKKRYKRQFTGQWGHIQYKAPVTASVLPHVLHSQHSPSDRPVLQQAIGNSVKLLYVLCRHVLSIGKYLSFEHQFPKITVFTEKYYYMLWVIAYREVGLCYRACVRSPLYINI